MPSNETTSKAEPLLFQTADMNKCLRQVGLALPFGSAPWHLPLNASHAGSTGALLHRQPPHQCFMRFMLSGSLSSLPSTPGFTCFASFISLLRGGGGRPDIHATASLGRPRLPPLHHPSPFPLFVFCGLPYFFPAGSLAVPDCTEIKIPRHPANCTFI